MRPPLQQVERIIWSEGQRTSDSDTVVTEVPVALVYNGVSHVVMMATPTHLDDLALGFSLSEDILQYPAQLLDFELQQREQGVELNLTIAAEAFAKLKDRRRNLTGRTGCGLCGIESLAQAIPAPARISQEWSVSHQAIAVAVDSLGSTQLLKGKTGGVHGAAWCSLQGDIELLREDVGRHNALDKLLGSLHHNAHSAHGFVLVTSRASYEMVAKVASHNIPLLAAVSAPTSLAIEQAEEAGVTLVAYAQAKRQVVFTHSHRLFDSVDI
jgi:FdhD protein